VAGVSRTDFIGPLVVHDYSVANYFESYAVTEGKMIDKMILQRSING
jgi:hypothetical protein